ncbi:Mlo-related protein [Cynara cardunculus var. scolymus]|uniref:MLO-like protein n=1 Tax=Cynara cardunculus var. scolymus TaxID=59895 RepID=A0A103YEK8_CYNCS|nr:Mlo-related protein [Cynara cardunculus var. scolymus]
MAGDGDARMLDQTATWSVAIVCAVIVILSVLLEHILHTVGHKRHKPGLMEALEKIKNEICYLTLELYLIGVPELMVLGFISLLLTFSQTYIASICVSKNLTKDFLPCKKQKYEKEGDIIEEGDGVERRRLLWYEQRRLAGGKPGYEEIISVAGLHQLHIFIFFLACFHVFYSAITMICGSIKTRKWKYWERDILQEHVSHGGMIIGELSFVKHHTGAFTQTPTMFYIVCFFRQFFMSVRKSDYLAMRTAFFSVHLSPGSHFNFQKYIKKSLEDDFKVIVGISPLLWATAVLFLFANVDERQSVVQGIPIVELSDRHFWFNQPRLILYLIQLTLFQNSFEITHFFWIWVIYEFGLDTCFHENPVLQYGRVLIGYSILPLYALVTQFLVFLESSNDMYLNCYVLMGSTMKRSIFDDQTSKVLKSWHQGAVKKEKSVHGKTKTLGNPTEAPAGAPGKGKPGDISRSVSSRQSANIVASVDIPDDKTPS